MSSCLAKEIVNLFRKPLPIPKSKFKIQLSIEYNVNHNPSTTLSSKYRKYRGVEIKEIINAPPFIPIDNAIFLLIVLFPG